MVLKAMVVLTVQFSSPAKKVDFMHFLEENLQFTTAVFRSTFRINHAVLWSPEFKAFSPNFRKSLYFNLEV